MTVYQELRDKVRRAIRDLSDDAIAGACSNFSEYRYMCGRAAGLDQAFTVFEEVMKAHFGEEEIN